MVINWITKWIGDFKWTHTIPSALFFPILLLLTYFGTWFWNKVRGKKLVMDLSSVVEMIAFGSALFWAWHGFKRCFVGMSGEEEHVILTHLAGSIAFLAGGISGTIHCIKKLMNSRQDDVFNVVFNGISSFSAPPNATPLNPDDNPLGH